MGTLRQLLAIRLLRPYISRELPGWGILYAAFVGDYRADEAWKGHERTWVRGKLHGYEMLLDLGQWSNRQTFFLKRFYDLPTQLLLQRMLREGDTFVDIGANEGMISLLASRIVGDQGRVIAFEPNPTPRSKLGLAIERNSISNIEVIAAGLGDTETVLPLSVPNINTGEGSFGNSNYSSQSLEVINCSVLRGDDVPSIMRPSLLKIDVEGFELRVLRGLEKTIEENKPLIVMEMFSDLLCRAESSVAEINSFLKQRGYHSYRLALSGRTKLKLISELPPDNAHADYFWIHAQRNESLANID